MEDYETEVNSIEYYETEVNSIENYETEVDTGLISHYTIGVTISHADCVNMPLIICCYVNLFYVYLFICLYVYVPTCILAQLACLRSLHACVLAYLRTCIHVCLLTHLHTCVSYIPVGRWEQSS